jgi:hypothetical protein
MRSLRRSILLPFCSALFGHAVPLSGAAQEATSVQVTSRAVEMAIGGRVQTLFSTTSAEAADPTAVPPVPAMWEMRRARLELAVRATPVLSGRLQSEFAGAQPAIRDAYLQFDLSPAARLWVGNAFRPFGLIPQTSSVLILPVERGARIRGVGALDHYNLVQGLGYADRDVGVQLRGALPGAPLGLNYAVGMFNGPDQAIAGERLSIQFAGRVGVVLAPDVRVGAGWSRRDFVRPTESVASPEVRAGTAWEVDLEYGGYAPGVHVVGEISWGDQDPFPTTADHPARFRAAQLWAGYRTPPLGARLTNLEPILRVSHGDPDLGPGGTLLTPGLNLYFGPLNRIMVNFEAWQPYGDGDTVYSLKTMFQMAF